jgi:hypothetical protein
MKNTNFIVKVIRIGTVKPRVTGLIEALFR